MSHGYINRPSLANMPRSTQVMKFTRKRKAKYSPYARKQARIDKTAGEKFSLARAVKSSGSKNTVLLERSYYYGDLSTTNNSTAAINFTLDSLPNYTELTALYDQYRIVGVKANIINTVPCNVAVYNAGTGLKEYLVPPTLISAVDLDDASATTTNAILEMESCIIHGGGRKHTRELVPACAEALYQGAFTGYGSRRNAWIDSSSPSVQHYGLKLGVKNVSSLTAFPGAFQIFITLIVEFKMPN